MAKPLFLLAVIALCSVSQMAVEACTGIKLVSKDSAMIYGRTVEFGRNLDLSLMVVPRGYAFTGTTPSGKGLAYTSKYAALGMSQGSALLDGINESGLSVAAFAFPEYARYAEVDALTQPLALSPLEFPHWLLTQFSTIEEVRAALAEILIAPTLSAQWGATPPAFHYMVTDRIGSCLIIEPVEGKLALYENKLGILTSAPPFHWHMNSLRQFIQSRLENAKPLSLNALDFLAFKPETRWNGLPGDFTASSRFIRAALLASQTLPAKNAEDSVYLAFHLLNQFDMPKGALQIEKQESADANHTLMTSVKDPQALKYYFKTYEDPSIRVIDLNQFDLNEAEIKYLRISETNQPERAVDISLEFES
jgi:choloylglycine hydrolase